MASQKFIGNKRIKILSWNCIVFSREFIFDEIYSVESIRPGLELENFMNEIAKNFQKKKNKY